MSISIAMATYNGAQYLQEQLDSIRSQTLLPDEIIVCDDGSNDATVKILEIFSAASPFVVKVISNEERLGYARNFEKAINLCGGDIIFLSDQDDVWFETKIERISREFKEHAATWVIVNDAELADADLKSNGLTVAGQLLSTGQPVEQLLLGCCIAFRSELKPLIMPVPYQSHGHDGWINTLGKALNCRYFVSDILQLYRRHESNTSGWYTTSTSPASKWGLFSEQIRWENIKVDPSVASAKRLEQLNILIDRLSVHTDYLQKVFPNEIDLHEVISRIEQGRDANELRLLLQQRTFGGRLIGALKFYNSGGYRQFSGWKSLVRDIIR